MHQQPVDSTTPADAAGAPHRPGAVVIYLIAFVTGAIVMIFEMLGSRYLNPYFGSGIYTWASILPTAPLPRPCSP